jgi:hypothetical protein
MIMRVSCTLFLARAEFRTTLYVCAVKEVRECYTLLGLGISSSDAYSLQAVGCKIKHFYRSLASLARAAVSKLMEVGTANPGGASCFVQNMVPWYATSMVMV